MPDTPEPAAAGRPAFDDFLQTVRTEAISRGVAAATIDRAFADLEPLPVVVQRDRAQAEFTLTLDQYMQRRLTPQLVRDTRRALQQNRALLGRISKTYGVPAAVIVSVWALESNLGRFAGVRPTIATLATLAWDGRRPFFRNELIAALMIVDRGDAQLEELKGSWAGAMGQVQFMPSSYLKYAEDFDRDGHRNIWSSKADVFASIANYLKLNGWAASEPWGREVRVPDASRDAVAAAAPLRADGCKAEREMTSELPLSRWRELGVTTKTEHPLPASDVDASLLRAGSRDFLLYPNYSTLLTYNCAHAYALSVAELSERLALPAAH